eukprot:13091398-Ditylum_brightwellii.AAC.1
MPKTKLRGKCSKTIECFVDEEEQECQRLLDEEEEADNKEYIECSAVIVIDSADELHAMPEEEHRIMIQRHYKEEKQQQLSLLRCNCEKSGKVTNGAALRAVTDG